MSFFKKITSVVKSAAKAVLPFAGAYLGNLILPGIGGTLIGGFLGGKAAGQSTAQAALGSVGSLVGAKVAGSGLLGSVVAGKAIPRMAASYIGGRLAQGLATKPAAKTVQPATVSGQPVSSVTAPAETQVVQANDPKIVEAQRRARRQAANSGRKSTIFAGMDALAPAKVTKKTLLGQ